MNTLTMNYRIFSKNLKDITLTDSLQVFHTINAYSYVIAEKAPRFKQALKNADILFPDGFPIVFAAKILNKEEITKIAGADLFYHFMQRMEQNKGRVFFIGSTDYTLDKIHQRATLDFPNVTIGVYSPPYKPIFTEEDSKKMISKINSFNADIVFVGMTAPKQEIWVETNKSKIQAKAILSIGAVFDFYAGTVKRAPNLMIKLNLEWFYRLIKEPKRMWKRYIVHSPLFFWYLLKCFMNK